MHISNWPDWLQLQIQDAERQFGVAKFPRREDESWRYSDIQKFNVREYVNEIPDQSSYAISAKISDLAGKFKNVICFYNGQYLPTPSRIHSSQDMFISPMSKLSRVDRESFLQKSFSRERNANLGGLSLDQLVSFTDGTVVRVENKKLPEQILIVQIVGPLLNQAKQNPFRISPRTYIEVSPSAHAEIVVVEVADHEVPHTMHHALDLILHEGAHCELAVARSLGSDAASFFDAQLNIGRNASCKLSDLSFSGQITRMDYRIQLKDVGASLDMRTLGVGRGHGYIDLSSSIQHLKGQTESHQISRGLYSEKSRGVFSGHLRIEQDAQLSNAKQLSQNIILSDSAEADTKPQLEVYADNVKAAHGATVGQLNDKEKFYLMSRGIPESIAQQLMVAGFARATFQNLKSREMRAILENFYEKTQSTSSEGRQ